MSCKNMDMDSIEESDKYFIVMTIESDPDNYYIKYFYGYVYKTGQDSIVIHTEYNNEIVAINIGDDCSCSYYRKSSSNPIKAELEGFIKINKYTTYVINIQYNIEKYNKYNVVSPGNALMWDISGSNCEIIYNSSCIGSFSVENENTSIKKLKRKFTEATSVSEIIVSDINTNVKNAFKDSYARISRQDIESINGFKLESDTIHKVNQFFDY